MSAQDFQSDELYYLRRKSLRAVLFSLLAVLYIWSGALFATKSWFAQWGWGPACLALGLVLAFTFQGHNLKMASVAAVTGLAAALLANIWRGDFRTAPYLLALVVGLAGLLFNVFTVVVVTVLCCASVIVIGTQRWNIELYSLEILSPTLLIGAVGLLSTLTMRNLFQALEWFRERAIAAQRNEEEARNRQGQLGRTLKALDEAYRRLEFANYDLARARETAEEAQRVKQTFAASVSHELRTPLNVMMAFSEIMYHSPERYFVGPPSPRFRTDTHELYRSSRHLLHLVNDVLDLTRVEVREMRMDFKVTALAPLITETLDMIRPLVDEAQVAVRAALPRELPLVEVDRARVQQVLLNLLNNARRFTDRGNISVTALPEDDFVRVTVADTGIGIAPDDHANVFKEFHQVQSAPERSQDGSGLGLAISRHFINLHGGRIWVESDGIPNHGSRFHFTLPVTGSERVLASQVLPRTALKLISPGRRGRILLLVGGPSDAAEMIEQRLEEYKVHTTAEVTDVPHLLETLHPHAILLNGPSTQEIERIWESMTAPQGRAVPVISCSLVAESNLSQALGVVDYLIKPVSRQTLLDTLQRFEGTVQRILIIDNDPQMVRLLASILEAGEAGHLHHYEVIQARGGKEGLDVMRQQHPDLILLDLIMPGVDGYQVLAQMREDVLLRSIPVIVVTAQTRTLEEERRLGGRSVTLTVPSGLSNAEALDYIAGLLAAIPPD